MFNWGNFFKSKETRVDTETRDHAMSGDPTENAIFRACASNQEGLLSKLLTAQPINTLSHSLAKKMIILEKGEEVIVHADRFKYAIHNELVHDLIDADLTEYVAENLFAFHELTNHTAQTLIAAGFSDAVFDNLENFTALNFVELTRASITMGNCAHLADALPNLIGVNHLEVLIGMIDHGETESVAEFARNFTQLDQNEVAQRLIEAGAADDVMAHIDNFPDLNQETKHQLGAHE